jgi:hypothetical protein
MHTWLGNLPIFTYHLEQSKDSMNQCQRQEERCAMNVAFGEGSSAISMAATSLKESLAEVLGIFHDSGPFKSDIGCGELRSACSKHDIDPMNTNRVGLGYGGAIDTCSRNGLTCQLMRGQRRNLAALLVNLSVACLVLRKSRPGQNSCRWTCQIEREFSVCHLACSKVRYFFRCG